MPDRSHPFTARVLALFTPMKKAEQYTNSGPWKASRGAKHWLKRLVKRGRRQAEQRDVENVPTRFTRGWH